MKENPHENSIHSHPRPPSAPPCVSRAALLLCACGTSKPSRFYLIPSALNAQAGASIDVAQSECTSDYSRWKSRRIWIARKLSRVESRAK
jgi:hypothetical protein